MNFLLPWGLAALAAVPAILAIHFFRRRLPPIVIAGLFLWPSDVRLPAVGRRLTRLSRTASLVLELAGVAILALVVAGLVWPRAGRVRHATVVVDVSASMGARGADGRSFLERGADVLEALLERSEDASDDLRLAVLVSGPRPALVAGPAATPKEALQRIRALVPASPSHSLAPAIELAREFASGSGALVILTDEAPGTENEAGQAAIVSGAESAANLAVLAARRLDPPGGATKLSFTVRNFDTGLGATTLSIRAGDALAREERIELAARTSRDFSYSLDGASLVRLEVSIDPGGALAIDDRAVLLPEWENPVILACDFERAGSIARRIERACRAAGGEWRSSPAGDEHIRVGAGWDAPEDLAPGAWWVGYGSADEPAEEIPPFVGPYFADPSDPVMAGLDLSGVIWGGARGQGRGGTAQGEAVAILSAGEHSLVWLVKEENRASYLFDVDPARTNIHKSPAWPLFWSRLVALRRQSFPGLAGANFVIGERPRLVLAGQEWGPPVDLEVRGPGGDTRRATLGGAGGLLPAPLEPGIHEVALAGKVAGRFAARFEDPDESDLANLSANHPESLSKSGASRAAELERGWLWSALLGAVAVLAIANWWILHPDPGAVWRTPLGAKEGRHP